VRNKVNFEFILPTKIIFNRGSVIKVGGELQELGARKALVVTSRGMLKRESFEQVANSLQDCRISFETFSEVEPEPPIENVYDCTTLAEEIECDSFVALGGGSVIDVVKKAAADLGLPKITVPTTAGTGNAVTHESVLKVDGNKQAFVAEDLTPDVAIIDPDLSKTMPARLAASSGIDALAHAIECYDSRKANPLVKALALEAYTIIKNNLKKAVGGDEGGMVNTALGSLIAGMAFGNSGTALAHALSYPLSNRGMPHGEAVALVLPYVLEFNNFDQEVIIEVRQIIKETGLSAKFDGDADEMAALVMKDKRHLANNPRKVTREDVVYIYQRIRRGVA